jgi:hypothetical protein
MLMFCLFLSHFFSTFIQHFEFKEASSASVLCVLYITVQNYSMMWRKYRLTISNTLQNIQLKYLASKMRLRPLSAGRNMKLILTPLWNDVVEIRRRSQRLALNVMAINSSICLFHPHNCIERQAICAATKPSTSHRIQSSNSSLLWNESGNIDRHRPYDFASLTCRRWSVILNQR